MGDASRPPIVVAAFALLALSLPAQAQEPKVYDWTFESGRLVKYSDKLKSTISLTLGGKPTGNLRYDIESTGFHRTGKIVRGMAPLESGTYHMRVKVKYGETTALWDSREEKLRKARTLPYIQPMAADYDRRYVFTMDVPGRKVVSMEIVPDNGAKSVTGPIDIEATKQDFQVGRRFFPTTPIGKGDSWPLEYRLLIDHNQAIQFEGERTLVGTIRYQGKACLKIQTVVKGRSVPHGEGGKQTWTVVEARSNVTTLFEIERGLLIYEKRKQKVKLSRKLNVKGKGEQLEVESREDESTSQVVSVTRENPPKAAPTRKTARKPSKKKTPKKAPAKKAPAKKP